MAENSKKSDGKYKFQIHIFQWGHSGKLTKKIHIRIKFNDKEKVLEAIIFKKSFYTPKIELANGVEDDTMYRDG